MKWTEVGDSFDLRDNEDNVFDLTPIKLAAFTARGAPVYQDSDSGSDEDHNDSLISIPGRDLVQTTGKPIESSSRSFGSSTARQWKFPTLLWKCWKTQNDYFKEVLFRPAFSVDELPRPCENLRKMESADNERLHSSILSHEVPPPCCTCCCRPCL